MIRLMLTDEHWLRLKAIMCEHGIYEKRNLRKTVEGILYRMRTGLPWRDLPSFFDQWISIYQQFNRWSSKNKLMTIFKALIIDPDLEWEFIDGNIVKAHQHSSGTASDGNKAIGKSVAGNTTKIHMAVDGYALPIDFMITGGEVHDCKVAPEFFARLPIADYTISDKEYDKEALLELIKKRGSIPVIPRKSNSIIGNDNMDWGLYKYRHLVENIFARLNIFAQSQQDTIN